MTALLATHLTDGKRPGSSSTPASLSPLSRPPADLARLLAEAVEAAANGIVITDRAGTILWVNAAFTKMTGYQLEEALGEKPRILKSGKHGPDFYRSLWDTITAGNIWRGTMCNKRKDGSEYYEEITITPIRDRGGQVANFIAIKQDITERMQLAEHQARLVGILEATPDFVGIADTNYRPLFLNHAGRQMMQCGEMEDLSQTHIGNYHPEWATKIVMNEGIPTAITRGAWMGETALLTRDGREIPVSQVILAHKAADGKVGFFSTIMRDLTEQQKLKEQLIQAQKMEAFGQLAGGVAHDFNNLLTIISGYSEIVMTMLSASDPKREAINAIAEAGERAASLTRQLLAFSRKTVLEPKVLDPNVIVKDTAKMLRRLIGEDVLLTLVLDPKTNWVKADPSQVTQVVMNLAVNARDAMPKGGKLTIQTAAVTLSRHDTQAHPKVKAGQYVMVAIRDTGHGMTPDVKARIFEPFFTTKGVGKGTGLGLAVVHGIVKQSGGHIEVDSEPDVGTTFRIYLPAVEDGHGASEDLGNAKELRGTEAVLLVEDEDAVRALAVLGLQTHGFRVLAARNGKEARRELEKHRGQIDILVTDVVMPHMSGRDLAEILKPKYPRMKVLYTSGYTDDAVVRHGIILDEVAFLQKPYTPLTLIRKVRDVLDLVKPR